MISTLCLFLKNYKRNDILHGFTRVRKHAEPLDNSTLFDANFESQLKTINLFCFDKLEKKVLKQRKDLQANLKQKIKEVFNDTYTDKDRAAAVSAGSYDIKQSLQFRKQQDPIEILRLTNDTDLSSFISLGLKEIKHTKTDIAIVCFSKALEINITDVQALVARSKCHLLLGEPSKALKDAERALNEDIKNMKAIYQKADSLYYLGQFEQSLMFFHRILRVRPEQDLNRLGVHKTQEAIQNTVGTYRRSKKSTKSAEDPSINEKFSQKVTISKYLQKKDSKKLLGELRVDKDFLENLRKQTYLKNRNTSTENNVSNVTAGAVEFLDMREEFWRQQRLCSVLLNHYNTPQDEILYWF